MTGEWLYGLWWGLGCMVGLALPMLLVIAALTWSRRELGTMLRSWLDKL